MRTFLIYIRELFVLSPLRFIMNLVLMAVLGMLEGAGVLMIIPLLMVAGVIPGMETSRGLALWVHQFFETFGITLNLPVVLAIYIGITLGYSLLQRYQSMLDFDIQQSYNVFLSIRLFREVAYADWQFLISKTKSDIANVLIMELGRIYSGINIFLQMLANLTVTLIQIILAFLIAPGLTCLVIFGAAILFFLLQTHVKKSRKVSKAISDLSRDLFSDLTQHLNGIKDVKSHGIESAQIHNFINIRNRLNQNSLKLNSIQTRTDLFYKVGISLFISLFLLFAIEVFKLNPQQFIMISVISARLLPKFSSLHMGMQRIINVLPAFQTANELDHQCINARENLPENEASNGMELKHGVEFGNVSFYYDNSREKYAVEEANFVLPAGTTTALVGVSGAGKSTVVDLLIGLLKPVRGIILIDGEPLVNHLKSWRKSIGYVPQDPFLLNTSIKENLLWACPGAAEAEIWEALRLASVDSFVYSLPDKLNTVVGDRGVRLSGGERQRIVLARALLRKPSILILDEATSSLDSENEERIQQAIENLKGKMTIVVIAHRISTIRNADKILVLEHGHIVEEGDYRSLLKNTAGRFHALACSHTECQQPRFTHLFSN